MLTPTQLRKLEAIQRRVTHYEVVAIKNTPTESRTVLIGYTAQHSRRGLVAPAIPAFPYRGHSLHTESAIGRCDKCKRLFVVNWRDREPTAEEVEAWLQVEREAQMRKQGEKFEAYLLTGGLAGKAVAA